MKYGKKIFKIINKIDVPGTNCINFHLNSIVHYHGGNYSSSLMTCTRSHPFNTWKTGDYLEVDLDKICYELEDNSVIYDANMVRILDERVTEEIRKSHKELHELKNAKDKLIPILNSFSQKIISRNFFTFDVIDVNEFSFDELSLPVWKAILNDISNEFDELKKFKRECNEWRTKFYNKNGENEGNKEKLEQERREHNRKELKWEGEKRESDIKIARLEENFNNANIQNTELKRKLTDTEKDRNNQVGGLEIKLDEKNEMIKGLNDQLTNLQLESGKKDNELKKKDEEIKRLKKWAELSREELLEEKLRSEKENLELFAAELKIDLEQIQSLIRYHERLFQARKKCNQVNIETHDSNIAQKKQELLEKEISIVNIQEICRKCHKMAEFSFELEQTQQRQIQMNDWKNINSNFTPELVQEWINYSFTYEQCREWINTTSPWQQNRAIKEPAYYAWLRDIKKTDAEWVLNHGNEQELGQEFFQWYQEQQQEQYQVYQEQPTK